MKGGIDILGYIERRYKDRSLEYNTIIAESSIYTTLEDMQNRLSRDGYHKYYYYRGQDFIAPYTMELKNIHIFVKEKG